MLVTSGRASLESSSTVETNQILAGVSFQEPQFPFVVSYIVL